MKRFLTPDEMNRLADLVERPDIQQAAGTDSEMVDGGYIADFTPHQMGYLATRFLPTGVPVSRRESTGG